MRNDATRSATESDALPPSPQTAFPTAGDVAARRADSVRVVVERGLLSDQSSVCAVFDLNTADELVTSLKDAYAGLDVLHTIAAKAVPLQALLRHLAQEHDLGCEVASPGELALALAAGFEPARIIYDSPAKTASDIAMALQLGVPFNIDNAEELARVDAMVAAWTGPLPRIGMRINPQSGAGLIHAMSTATQTSKFGIGLVDSRDAVIEMYLSRPWLRQIHVHSGSQGLALEHTANDVRAVVELAEDIERAAGEQRIELIDVGGGLSVTFESDLTAPTFHDHASALREAAPALFTGKYQIATEFGRSLTAKAGTLLGNVEYVKQAGPRSIAVTHVGVQVAARTVFMPQAWPLRIEVYAPDGTRRTAETAETGIYDVAGPACFAGDLIAVERALPKIESGDIIAVPDTGGYYATNHFAYNSLARPAIYATRAGGLGEPRTLLLARRAQTIAEVVAESGEAVLSELR